jgi:rSAM/selenodomain-associated transferase 2
VILVDGGSEDGTPEIAGSAVDLLVISDRGRAIQMNAGARQAGGDIYIFLHADTLLPWESLQAMLGQFGASDSAWGRFDVRLSNDRFMLRLIGWLINRRTRLTGIATGDQAIFVRREAFETIGGFPEIALMEDIEISRRLKRLTPPLSLREHVTTSSRRWDERGIVRTTLLMWRLRLAYAFGADPERLAKKYE